MTGIALIDGAVNPAHPALQGARIMKLGDSGSVRVHEVDLSVPLVVGRLPGERDPAVRARERAVCLPRQCAGGDCEDEPSPLIAENLSAVAAFF